MDIGKVETEGVLCRFWQPCAMIFLARLISNRKVGKRLLMGHLYIEISFYQDRLGTNIGKALGKKRAFAYVLQENASVAVLFSTFALLAGVRGVVCELLTAALMASIGTAAKKRPFPLRFLLL